jgi:hypothetical protein
MRASAARRAVLPLAMSPLLGACRPCRRASNRAATHRGDKPSRRSNASRRFFWTCYFS